MIPERLENWTLSALEHLCTAGQSESDRHDFKLTLSDSKNTTKLCCAFANSFGGFLIVGIRDADGRFEIEGVQPNSELYGQLVAKIKADPGMSIPPPMVIEIPTSTKVIYVFEIPQSPRRPHLPTPPDWRFFWKRAGSDCVQMSLEEVRYQMNTYEEKREKLALLLMELWHIVRSLEEQAGVPDGTYNGTIFRFDIIDRVIVESYSILKDDPNTIGVLDTVKKRLMQVNAEKQKLLSRMAQDYVPIQKSGMADVYRQFVKDATPGVYILVEQIERSFRERYGIESPYRTQFANR